MQKLCIYYFILSVYSIYKYQKHRNISRVYRRNLLGMAFCNFVFFLFLAFHFFLTSVMDCQTNSGESIFIQFYTITFFYIAVYFNGTLQEKRFSVQKILLLIFLMSCGSSLLFVRSEQLSDFISLGVVYSSIIFYAYSEYRFLKRKFSGNFQFRKYELVNLFLVQIDLIVVLLLFFQYYFCEVLWMRVLSLLICLFIQQYSFHKTVWGFDWLLKNIQMENASVGMDEELQLNRKFDEENLMNRIIYLFETEKIYLQKNLQINDVAARLYTNKSYVSKTINGELNKSFRDYVNYHRVRESMKLYLADSSINMEEMYTQSGFKNYTSFSTAFKIHTGKTPGEWRRNNNTKKIDNENRNEKVEQDV